MSDPTKLQILLSEERIHKNHKRFYQLCCDPVWLGDQFKSEQEKIDKSVLFMQHLLVCARRAEPVIAEIDKCLLVVQEQILQERQRLASENLHSGTTPRRGASRVTSPRQLTDEQETCIATLIIATGWTREQAVKMITARV